MFQKKILVCHFQLCHLRHRCLKSAPARGDGLNVPYGENAFHPIWESADRDLRVGGSGATSCPPSATETCSPCAAPGSALARKCDISRKFSFLKERTDRWDIRAVNEGTSQRRLCSCRRPRDTRQWMSGQLRVFKVGGNVLIFSFSPNKMRVLCFFSFFFFSPPP